MSTIANMMVNLGLNASGYSSGLQKANAETKKFQDQLKQVQKTGEGISKVGTAITTGVTLPVIAAGTALTKFAMDAQKSIQVERSFNAVAKSAGFMGSEMLSALQKSSQGLVSNTELMRNFNLAASLVGREFATNLPNAFSYLGKVSASTGQSMDYMLDSLIRGVGRLSPLILDNLGIQVSLNEAYEEWAQVNDRAVDSMTKTEQQMAVMDQVMRKLKENTAGMSDEFGTTGERIKTSMENAKDAIGRNLVPALESAGSKLTDVIGKFGSLFDEGQALNPVITATGDMLGNLANGISDVVNWLGQLDPATVESATKFVLFVAAAGPVLAIFGKLISTGASVVSTLTSIGAAFGLAGSAAALGGGAFALALTGVGLAIYGVIQAEKDLEVRQENQRSLWTELKKAVDDGRISIEQYDIISADVHRGFISLEQAISQIPPSLNQTTDAVQDQIDALLLSSKTYEEFQAGIAALGVSLPLMTEEIWNESRALEGVAESAGETAEVIKELTTEQLALNSQIAFVHDNLKTYNDLMGELTAAKEAYEALPQWKKDQDEGLALLGIMGDINNKFETMVAQANAQSLFEAIMGNGEATRAEFQVYLSYLEQTGLATKETTEKMMEHWEATNAFLQSLSRDAEGNVTITVDDGSALQTIADIKAQLSGIERNIGVTVTVTQIGQYLTGPVGEYKRALGGPVEANTTYLVGERGAELFVPEVDGKIIPHHEMNKYVQKGNPESVSASFDSFEDNDSPEMVQNNYNLTLNTTASESGVITAFRIMEALNT